MAVVYPNANGVWSDTTNWYDDATGLPTGQLPQATDDVLLNGKNLTVDMDIEINSITNSAGTTAIAAGRVLMPTGGYSFFAHGDILASAYNGNFIGLINPSHTAGGHTEITCLGKMRGGDAGNYQNAVFVNIGIGNSCTINFNELERGTFHTLNYAIDLRGATGDIVLNCTAPYWKPTTNQAFPTINSNITNTGSLIINCNIESNANNLEKDYFIFINGNAEVVINGYVNGSKFLGGSAPIALTANTNLFINGLTSGFVGSAITTTAAGINVTLLDAKAGTVPAVYVPNSNITVLGDFTCTDGVFPTISLKLYLSTGIGQLWTFQTSTIDKVLTDTLTDVGSPIEADVRKNTVYGSGSQFTGTLAVPTPNQVLIDVPTDDTVGTFTGGESIDYSAIADIVGNVVANNFP